MSYHDDDDYDYGESRCMTSGKYQAILKNEELVDDLSVKRTEFAGIGTNKAKRRLNKIAGSSAVAAAVRLALEIEDRNITAKKYRGSYKDRAYEDKHKLILDLCDLFMGHGWTYGIQGSQVPCATHVIYFDIPGCGQLSWHFSLEYEDGFPRYEGKWDGQKNSSLGKLERITRELLGEKGLKP
jgi:hypothetical protein